MPTCTTIIMYHFNPTVLNIVDGVERVLSCRGLPAIRWVRSIIATALEVPHESVNGQCAGINSTLPARGHAIERHDLEQSP
jgi:hypothetical protein